MKKPWILENKITPFFKLMETIGLHFKIRSILGSFRGGISYLPSAGGP
jgi:hypothetical protein